MADQFRLKYESKGLSKEVLSSIILKDTHKEDYFSVLNIIADYLEDDFKIGNQFWTNGIYKIFKIKYSGFELLEF